MEASQPLSLEQKLTLYHSSRIEFAEQTIEDAQYNLGRISLIYSGQMHFDFDEPPYDPDTMNNGRW